MKSVMNVDQLSLPFSPSFFTRLLLDQMCMEFASSLQ